jgi:hypothetical protein
VEPYVQSLDFYETCRNSSANLQTACELVWWVPMGPDGDLKTVVTESSANSERGLPHGTQRTVDDWYFEIISLNIAIGLK